jgi:LuxR family maltose regulon positive regulatory protein
MALIEEHLPRPFGSARIASYTQLLAGLEHGDALATHPVVAAFAARIHALSGRPEAAARCALLADRSPGDRVPEPEAIAFALTVRATLCRDGVEAMHADATRAVELSREHGPCRATALLLLGAAELLRGDGERADRLLADSIADATGLDAPDTVAAALAERALIAADRGDWDRVDGWVAEATDIVREAGLEQYVVSTIVSAVAARLELRRGDVLTATRHVEHTHSLLPLLTTAIPWLSAQVRLELADAHLALGDRVRAEAVLAEVDESLGRGANLGTLAVRLDAVRSRLECEREPGGAPAGLTRAERRLLPLLATHLTFREIAGELEISRNTVKTQAISVYRKLRVTSRADAIEAASTLELITGRSLHLAGTDLDRR